MAVIEARGLKHFVKYLKAAGDVALPAQIRVANLEVAKSLADEISRAAPVGTVQEGDKHPGKLGAATKAFATPTTARVQIGRGLVYAKPVIFGWKKHGIAKNEYPYRIVDARRPDIVTRYHAALAAALKENV